MLKGAAYIRVSTDKQDEYSPDAQKRLIYEYAQKNNILISPDDVYTEIGISGKQAEKRPRFLDMIAKCKEKSHPIDVILVWKFSRFARNQEESIVYKRILKKIHVDVVSISEPIPEGFIGELVERIFEWMDEYYSINLAGEVRRGMTQKAMSGGYMSKLPYGYTRGENGIPEINAQQASVVKTIYNNFAYKNMGFSSIARYLNSANIKTGTGNTWSAKTLRYLLQNPFYIGKIRWNYQPSNGSGRYINKDFILVNGKHSPIIEEKTFEICQNKINFYSNPDTAGKTYTEKRKHWLSGLLKCSSCGGSMGYASKGKNKTAYFRCTRYGRGQCSCSNGIIVPRIEQAVYEALRPVITMDLYHTISINHHTTESETIENFMRLINVKQERIRLAYINGIDSLEDYQYNKELLNRERLNLVRRLEDLKTTDCKTSKNKFTEFKTVSALLADKNISESIKSIAIRSICDKIVYSKATETLDFYFINHSISNST